MADFTFYGGLYRDVNVISVPETHFDLDYYGTHGIAVTPIVEGANASVEVEVFVTDATEEDTLEYVIKMVMKLLLQRAFLQMRQRLHSRLKMFIFGMAVRTHTFTQQKLH